MGRTVLRGPFSQPSKVRWWDISIHACVDFGARGPSFRANSTETAALARPFDILAATGRTSTENGHEVRNSLKSLRGRHRDNRIVRRKGRVYVINKTQRRFKARQG